MLTGARRVSASLAECMRHRMAQSHVTYRRPWHRHSTFDQRCNSTTLRCNSTTLCCNRTRQRGNVCQSSCHRAVVDKRARCICTDVSTFHAVCSRMPCKKTRSYAPTHSTHTHTRTHTDPASLQSGFEFKNHDYVRIIRSTVRFSM